MNELIQKKLDEKATEEAKEKVSAKLATEFAKWLKGYAKKKPVKNFGGNFWGFNRNRCSIIKPAMILALVVGGHVTMNGTKEFTVN